MVYDMKLSSSPFEAMASGEKTIEIRLFDKKRRKLEIGDRIIFSMLDDPNRRIAVRITALFRFATFLELFSEISPERCGSAKGTSAAEAAAGMRKYYSSENEKRYGVLGIKVELIDLEETINDQCAEHYAELERLFPDGIK